MDDLLPSYESTIKQDPWELIAPYLDSQTLCAASLVCQRWHEMFAPHLWGNPASHFGVQNDTVYVALTRFKRTLYWARVSVRELTHTLQLPPAHAEIYGGPHYEWLRDCLERLPRLQCLIVDGLPFFDHASLLTLRHSSSWWRQTHPNAYPVFGLRLLDASGCSNSTSTGLTEALPHFPDLVSLDLSQTVAAKHGSVFSQLASLRNLRILKLSGLGLKDTELSNISSSIGVRVRSLDVSDNQLTDASARLLLENCMKEVQVRRQSHRAISPRSPVPYDRPNDELDDPSAEDLDGHLRKKLTKGFVGSLAIERAGEVGITHLYISKNYMTVEGVSGLLRSERLQVLDLGTLPSTLPYPHQSLSEEREELPLPGVEKLTPVLAQYASRKLIYLRTNYTIVTNDCPMDLSFSRGVELEGDPGLHTPSPIHEALAEAQLRTELDSQGPAVHELPGDYMQPEELPDLSIAGIDKREQTCTPIIEVSEDQSHRNSGLLKSPNTLNHEGTCSALLSPTLDATGGLSPILMASDDKVSICAVDNANDKISMQDNIDDKIAIQRSRHDSPQFAEDRRAQLELRQSQENRLHPGMLPKVQTLVLTGVPSQTHDETIAQRLIQFIKDCAEEVNIARLRANRTYMLPPGRNRKIAEQEYVRTLFALRRIVLEVAPPLSMPKKITSSWRAYPTKSSTEDADSEAFWEAATHDFSFFDDEECGLPTSEPGRGLPLAAMSGLMLDVRKPAAPAQVRQPEPAFKPMVDVIGEISKFRKEKKAAYDAALRSPDSEPLIEGYWPGTITVVRMQENPDAGSLDYYGNKFEAGYLYR
ncbi:hypothetical protein DM02DRAFT_641326 [Periconia macrospinosa]|uniref:F-box domain-containing protein n=1 Tax=Periconia macrospinosa TaxID=97972 RepID=A0A2V1DWL4_9PLEO|nr:hypothetical protein DM02DRAFT_641326 [Periconia macrospinosa]